MDLGPRSPGPTSAQRLIDIAVNDSRTGKSRVTFDPHGRRPPTLYAVVVSEYTDLLCGPAPCHQCRHDVSRVAENRACRRNWLAHADGYNGARVSTVMVVSTPTPNRPTRPRSKTRQGFFFLGRAPVFSPSERLDIGLSLAHRWHLLPKTGDTPALAQADEMIFGYGLADRLVRTRQSSVGSIKRLALVQAKALRHSISPWIRDQSRR